MSSTPSGNDGEGELAQCLCLRAVGNGVGCGYLHDVPGLERLLAVIACFRLHTHQATPRRHGLRGQRAARQQAATAHADEQVVQPRHLFQQLHRCCALACNDVGVVKRRHQRHAAFLRQAAADGFAVFGVAVVGHHLRAIFARGSHLGCGGVFRHHDHGGHVEQAGRQRNRLGMVTGRKGQHATFALLRGELGQGVVGAAGT